MKNAQRIGLILVSCLIVIGVLSVFYIMLHLSQSKFSRQVEDNRFFVEFYPLNGELAESFLLKKGDVIETYIIRNKGDLKIVIGQQGQEPIYEGSNFSGSFQVKVPEDGSYTITVSGKKADGSTDFKMLSQASMYSDADSSIDTYTDRIPDVTETLTVEEAYAVVIGKYYTAIEQQRDSAALMEDNLNYMVSECYGDDPLKNIGYMIEDIDGDGIEELLLGALVDDSFYGKMIFALYTLDDKVIHQLVFDSSERNRYYYAGENFFANVGTGALGESFETTVKFEDGEIIDMTYITDLADYVQAELTPFSEWIK